MRGAVGAVADPVVRTAVREYGGTIVFGRYALAEPRWYLGVRERGRAQRRLAVAPGGYPRGMSGERNISGFADTGAEPYEVLGCWPAESVAGEPFAGCRIDALKPPAYAASRPPLG